MKTIEIQQHHGNHRKLNRTSAISQKVSWK